MPSLLPKALLAVLCAAALASPVPAETLSVTTPIVDGDLAAARAEAVRELLFEAGIRGDVLVQSKSALVQEDAVQATVIRSSYRLRRFSIEREEAAGNILSVTALVEKEAAARADCDKGLPLGNIEFGWREPRDGQWGEAARQAALAFGAALQEGLRSDVGDFLLSPGALPSNAVYRIQAELETADQSAGLSVRTPAVHFRISAAVNGAPIRAFSVPGKHGRIATKEKHNLGYAQLWRWTLTDEGRALVDAARHKLADEIRCLPSLVRIPETSQDGAFSIYSTIAPEIAERGFVFYAANWPITENGGLDLLRIDGLLQPQLDGNALHFPGARRQPGRRPPVAGGYLVFQ